MKKQIMLERINRKEVLRYLGYKGISADATVNMLIDECEAEVIKAAVPRYTYRVTGVTQTADGVELDGTGLILRGNSIKEHLKGCDRAALIAVTLSEGIDRMLRIMQTLDLAKAVVSDSLASAAIEQVCDLAECDNQFLDKLEAIIKEELPEYNQTFRFGIGYGDLPLSQQGEFLKVLNAPKLIGLNVGKTDMMVPTKSVTAVIGLTTGEVSAKNKGCMSCNLKGTCSFRESGGHCNG